jgi:hypothetical protein
LFWFLGCKSCEALRGHADKHRYDNWSYIARRTRQVSKRRPGAKAGNAPAHSKQYGPKSERAIELGRAW